MLPTCPLSRSSAVIKQLSNIDLAYLVQSEICGRYFITDEIIHELNSKAEITNAHLNLAFETIIASKSKIPLAWVKNRNTSVKWPDPNAIPKVFEEYATIPIDHSLKETNLLRHMADQLTDQAPTSSVSFKKDDLFLLKMRDFDEMSEWLWSLHENEYISINVQKGTRVNSRNGWQSALQSGQCIAAVNPKGWNKVATIQSHSHTKIVFIAQAFAMPLKIQVRDAIKASFNNSMISAESIECEEYSGPIIDQIKAKIRKSKCVVADLTKHRTGVYYEAGYAEGLDIPVIYTCKKDDLESTHFDVKHLNIIQWENEEQLTERLKNRFEALFGPLQR